ncbi:formylglycine-generating enzyme family protein [Uliginosibacterium sp. H3]|uniref:Formylglycine-generating enzyme family protein n=1 Tax=Uliginosibacterium silvisoli TaxID=3114758 RepID=A0ABU6K5U1_9RHOO|nr:formylglycine-generating enzyme family protein [Uliginosibacterium sp. H3]
MFTTGTRARIMQMACIAALAQSGTAYGAAAPRYVQIPGGLFRTALPVDGAKVAVAPFRLRAQPVSRREYEAFLHRHREWQPGRVPALFADERYLAGWETSPGLPDAPATAISWYAANAYCASEQARLPSWHEWEFVAAADATRRDARDDPAWREEIIGWYEKPASMSLPAMSSQHPNAYGVHNMHRLIWEWVEDFNGLFVTVDSRNQGEQKLLETCGAAALSLGDRDNYAILMRVALLSSVSARDSLESMGFRCARNH